MWVSGDLVGYMSTSGYWPEYPPSSTEKPAASMNVLHAGRPDYGSKTPDVNPEHMAKVSHLKYVFQGLFLADSNTTSLETILEKVDSNDKTPLMVLMQVIRIVSRIHEQGFVHNGLNPQNIWVIFGGQVGVLNTDQVSTANVKSSTLQASIRGAEKMLQKEAITWYTKLQFNGRTIKKELKKMFPYVAPEIVLSKGNPTPSSDVYSICMMLNTTLKMVVHDDKIWQPLREIVRQGIHSDPMQRPKLREIEKELLATIPKEST